MFQENWLTGIGVGNFKALAPSYQEPGQTVQAIAHNTYIQLLAELGIFGLLAFGGTLVAAFASLQRTATQALRLRSGLLYHSASGIQGGLIGYAVGAFFVSAEYQRLLWFMVFVSICLATLTRRAARQAAREASRAKRPAPETSAARGES
jgi:O-antigen ligase